MKIRKEKHNINKKIMFLFVIAAVFFSALSVILLLVLPDSGEAKHRLQREEMSNDILSNAKKLIPEASILEETSGGAEDSFEYSLKDIKGNYVGYVVADNITGQIEFLFDASEEFHSGDPKINVDEAQKKAEEFLKEQGVDITYYGLEKEPLRCVGMEGPPDNPQPVYQYDFLFRIQVDGIFVDDFINGSGFCFVMMASDDGRIISFGLPKMHIPIQSSNIREKQLEREDAFKLAAEKAREEVSRFNIDTKDLTQLTPIVNAEGIELRYLLQEGYELEPYWMIEVNFNEMALSEGLLESCPSATVGVGISAHDGGVVLIERYR